MQTKKLTMVLGAGASLAMGYPLGSELRERILAKTGYENILLDGADSHIVDHFDDFIHEFKKSQIASIDSFLGRRLEFSDIGKQAIAAILMSIENFESLSDCVYSDHWYYTFYQTLISHHTWDSLDLSYISIVSFNYDRSFEHYLMHALAASFNKSLTEACNKIQEMKIIHVYGIVGTCNPSSKNYRKYGDPYDLNKIKESANQIKVIPESREDDITFNEAKNLLSSAHKIAFLGFGFDDLNLRRLNSNTTCKSIIGSQNKFHNTSLSRKIVGTCFGLTEAEKLRVNKMTAGYNQFQFPNGLKNFPDCNCSQLLRETLIALPSL